MKQLPLLIPGTPCHDAASFLHGESNAAARAWLDRTESWPDRRLALWGAGARGKTHLLRIWCARTGADYLEGAALTGFPALPSARGVAVDDADRADESALLHLLNAARDVDCPGECPVGGPVGGPVGCPGGCPVLLAASAPPARWTVALPDLASRLRAMTAVEIAAPDDDLLRRLLLRLLTEHRLSAEPALHEWLLTRLPRNPEALRAAVARLDHDALVSRRRTVSPAMLRAALPGEEG